MFVRKPGKGITLEMYIRNTQVNKKKKKRKKKKEWCLRQGLHVLPQLSLTMPYLHFKDEHIGLHRSNTCLEDHFRRKAQAGVTPQLSYPEAQAFTKSILFPTWPSQF